MYNIIQLNDKNLSELQQIAKELGLKKVDSLKKKSWCIVSWMSRQLSVRQKSGRTAKQRRTQGRTAT